MVSWEGIDRSLFMMALAAYLAAAGQLYRKTSVCWPAVRLTMLLGLAANMMAIIVRGRASGHLPCADMYGFGMVFVFFTVILTGILVRRYKVSQLPVFAMPMLIFLACVILLFYHASRPLVPALKSCWLMLHVVSAVIAYGALTLACAVAVMYMWRHRLEEKEQRGEAVQLLPSLEQLDVLAGRLVSWAMPFLTLLIVTGAVWAEYAWGAYWQWDPKETWALITWVIYAVYLHGRRVLKWRGVYANGLLISGFMAVLITFLGINLLKSGLHAYF